MKNILLAIVAVTIISCTSSKENRFLQNGAYRGILKLDNNKKIPFNFDVTSKNTLTIFNADEVIHVDEITYHNDSITIQMPIFEGYIKAIITENNTLLGNFIKPTSNRIVPFEAKLDKNRFDKTAKPITNISGNWETTFSPDNNDSRYIAKGIFKQNNEKVTGTFRTTTGDYRYLEGTVSGDSLYLSTFDGAHAFLFEAKVTDSTLTGTFYSGNHWKEPFVAKKNDNYELPDPDTLTSLKNKDQRFTFSFPNEKGKMISLDHENFKNKVVVVQIMGSWCPNCLDESRYYSDFYRNYKNKDLAFVGLAFEVAKTPDEAFEAIKRLKEGTGIEYPILLAQYGSADKLMAQEKLPMLDKVLSYPTTVIIDKKGEVRKIHTGFNGPATGEKYYEFTSNFKNLIDKLLAE